MFPARTNTVLELSTFTSIAPFATIKAPNNYKEKSVPREENVAFGGIVHAIWMFICWPGYS